MDGEIAAAWPQVRLSEVCALRREALDPRSYPEEVFSHFSIPAYDDGRAPIEQRGKSIHSGKFRVPRDCVLLSKLNPRISRVWMPIVEQQRRAICSTEFLVLEPHPERLLRRFLYHVLRLQGTVDSLTAGAAATTGSHQRVRPDDVLAWRLLLPTPAAQAAVVEILDAIDEAIEKTDAVIAATEELRKALLQELLTRGVPGWHTEWRPVPGIGEIPACWEVVRLGDCGTWLSGGTPSKDRDDYWTGDLPWFSPKDMKRRELLDAIDHVSEAGASASSKIVGPGTIFMVVRGMILAHSFPVAITRVRCAFNQDIKAVVCNAEIDPDFLLLVLEHRKSELVELPTPSTHGTMRVMTEELHALVVPLPPVTEQRMIIGAVRSIDARVAAEAFAMDALRESKIVTAEALLSGRVRTRMGSEVVRESA